MLTNILACCRSPDTSTSVTLTMPAPTRSSLMSLSNIWLISRLIREATRETRRVVAIISPLVIQYGQCWECGQLVNFGFSMLPYPPGERLLAGEWGGDDRR